MGQSQFKKAFFSIYSYTVFFALFGVFSLSYHACFNSCLSTLEKRFRFSSSAGSFVMITDNVATLLTTLFIGYYGKTAHKPRWMAVGCVITGLSVLLTSAPYFIYGPAQEADLEFSGNLTISKAARKKTSFQTCDANPLAENCDQLMSGSRMTAIALLFFSVSNFFRGFGTSIYFTYGTPYLDDNVSKAKMPTFFAFIFATRLLGAPLGFYISYMTLKIYENPFAPPQNLVHTDPRWIGAWWIGFLFSGTCMLLLAIPLAFFPREFRKHKSEVSDEQYMNNLPLNDQAEKGETDNLPDISSSPKAIEPVRKAAKKTDLRELPREVLSVVSNPLIACQMMGNMFRGMGLIGYFVFQPKYLESQFRQSASKAGLVSGTTGFTTKVFGILFGGFVITLLRPGPRKLTSFIFLVEVTSVITLLIGASVLGPQYSYPMTELDRNNQLVLDNECNRACGCQNVRYQPVCEHVDMKAYFSPCHAGCKNAHQEVGNETWHFTDCSCIDSQVKTLEKCPPDTEKLYKYAMIVALGGMISGSSRSGNMVTFFRSIQPEQKALATAITSFWHSLMVSIPYPIIYGKIFDYSCLVWSYECGQRGNCWLYDTNKLRKVYHGVSIALIALGSVFDLVMIFLSPRLGNLYDDDGKRETMIKKAFRKVGLIKKTDKDKSDADQGQVLQITRL